MTTRQLKRLRLERLKLQTTKRLKVKFDREQRENRNNLKQ